MDDQISPSVAYQQIQWYQTARTSKLWNVDGRFFPLIIIFMMGISVWKIGLLVLIFLFLSYLSLKLFVLDYILSLRFRVGLWLNETRFGKIKKDKGKKNWFYRHTLPLDILIRNRFKF